MKWNSMNKTLTSLCSASYVRWQRATARIHSPHAALLCAMQQSIDISCRLGPQQQRVCCCKPMLGQTDRQTDGRTPDRCTNSTPHSMLAVPITIRWIVIDGSLEVCTVHGRLSSRMAGGKLFLHPSCGLTEAKLRFLLGFLQKVADIIQAAEFK